MQVNALDHVNISTSDLDASARFYAEILNLDARPAPGLPLDGFRWLHDSQGRAVVHLRQLDNEGGATGAIHQSPLPVPAGPSCAPGWRRAVSVIGLIISKQQACIRSFSRTRTASCWNSTS